MPLTVALAMDIVAEVIRHMHSLPVTPPPPMEAPGMVSGVLAPVGHSYSSLHLLSLEVFLHTNLLGSDGHSVSDHRCLLNIVLARDHFITNLK